MLSEALKTNTTVTTLNLCCMKHHFFTQLFETIITNSTVNDIGKEGAVALSEAMKKNSFLRKLDLDGLRLHILKTLFLFLKNNLIDEGNNIMDEGTTPLSEALKTNTTLTELILWSKNLQNRNLREISVHAK